MVYIQPSQGANSNNTELTPQAQTMTNTAYYDAVSKCIKLPIAPEEEGDDKGGVRSILEGSIIEMDIPSNFQLGNQMLLGEIYEIGKLFSLYCNSSLYDIIFLLQCKIAHMICSTLFHY